MTRRRNGGRNAMPVVWFVMALGAAAPAAGQAGTEPRIWMNVSTQGRVGADSPWRWSSDSVVRTRDGAGSLDFLYEGVMVSRDLTERSGAGFGYAYAVGFFHAGSLGEHRFIQQYAWSGGARRRVSLRTRVEERFITGHETMLLRVRQQVRVTWPLAAGGRLQAVVAEELFVQGNATASTWGFDTNQMFVGVARTLTPRNRVEIGYLNVYSRGGPSTNPQSHVMSVTLLVAL